ncbi:hypothetical protein [Embleya sp. MST-111070]|uniref:hypothetical protein n=1 Tax=Embleya sp. MST-111070 TaxID=3398231 RepID=UPI003F73CA1C
MIHRDAEQHGLNHLFREVIDGTEPPLTPIASTVPAAGTRLRRRRRLRNGGLTALLGAGTAVVVFIAAPWQSNGTPASERAAAAPPVGVTASPSGRVESTPLPRAGGASIPELHARLRAAIAGHLPPGIVSVADGHDPMHFAMVDSDGRRRTLYTISGVARTPGSTDLSPCEAKPDATTGEMNVYGKDCRFERLADGSTGWLSNTRIPGASQFTLVTPQGSVVGLGSDNSTGPVLSLDDLFAPASAPEVFAALTTVPNPPTAPTGS